MLTSEGECCGHLNLVLDDDDAIRELLGADLRLLRNGVARTRVRCDLRHGVPRLLDDGNFREGGLNCNGAI
jgi:hypothetical protein